MTILTNMKRKQKVNDLDWPVEVKLETRDKYGVYKPSPVKKVEIPKQNGEIRLLGMPTVIDRLIQQEINQIIN